MKRLLLLASVAMIFAPIEARAQTTVQTTVRVVGTCGSGVTWTAGKMNFPTVDTTGVLCTASGGGGAVVAGLTAEATATAVAAGTNKPQSEDTANGAARTELCKPGTTTCVDPTAPSVLAGTDGSTAMSPSNPLEAHLNAGTAVIGHVINDASSAVIGHVITDTGSTTVLGAGTALAGKFGIDQTTPGTTNAVAIKDTNNVAPDFTLTSPTAQIGPYPGKNTAGVVSAATPETCSSGNVANATVACTLATAAAKTTYISGFTMTADGATVGLAVSCTLTGTITGTMTFTFSYPAGIAVAGAPLIVQFNPAIPASTTNTTIVASCPASGTGGTNAAMSAWGYQL